MSNTIAELRDRLFKTLDGLQDKDNPIDIDRARAINETAQTIINSTKVEVDYLKITGGKGTGFIKSDFDQVPAIPQTSQTSAGLKTVTGKVTQHRMK